MRVVPPFENKEMKDFIEEGYHSIRQFPTKANKP